MHRGFDCISTADGAQAPRQVKLCGEQKYVSSVPRDSNKSPAPYAVVELPEGKLQR